MGSEQDNINQNDLAIRVRNLNKTFRLIHGKSPTIKQTFKSLMLGKKKLKKTKLVLQAINFDVEKGQVFGIIGRNGSGKSTILNILLGSLIGDKNSEVYTAGKVLRLALGMGFDPNLSAKENVYINGSILGMSFKYIGRKFRDIIDFSGLSEYVNTPIKHFSSGMRARLSFSIAMHAKADIVLMDEFFGSVGDTEFKKKSKDFFSQTFMDKRTIVIVSHNMKEVLRVCDKVLWLENGKVRMIGEAKDVVAQYRKSAKDQEAFEKVSKSV